MLCYTNKLKLNLYEDTEKEHELNDFDINKLYMDEMKDFINLIENNCINHPLDFNQAILNTELMLEIHKEN